MTDLSIALGPASRQHISHVIRAEVSKLRTVRSTTWTLLATLAGALLVTGLAAQHAAGRPAYTFRGGGFDSTNMSLTGLAIASLTIGVLGVLAISGEYGTGTIRSSLSATPRRSLFVAAKIIIVGLLALVVGELLSFGCFFLGQSIISGTNAPTASLGHTAVWHAVALSGAYLALLALFALGLGLIIRHTAGAIAAYAGCTLLTAVVLQSVAGNPARFTPVDIYANSVSAALPQSGQLSALSGFGFMALYAAVTLGVGALLLNRRDA